MHLSLFFIENELFFRRSFFWEMMIYKGLLRIVFAFPVSPKF